MKPAGSAVGRERKRRARRDGPHHIEEHSLVRTTTCLMIAFLSARTSLAQEAPDMAAALRFESGTFDGWTVEGAGTWVVQRNPEFQMSPGLPDLYVAFSLGASGETGTGRLRSGPFVIEKDLQEFYVVGADGTERATNDGNRNYIALRAHPDGEILRTMRPPGTHKLTKVKWHTTDLIGRKAYLEVVDENPMLNSRGFAWIGIAGYKQIDWQLLTNPVRRDDLYGVRIDANASRALCRTMPFLAALPENRGETRRTIKGKTETIAVRSEAEAIYLLGMINEGWDHGVAHWGEHPELREMRDDQLYVGARIGEIEIRYTDGRSDLVPVVIGATAWFVSQWAHGPSHNFEGAVREPFRSRPEYAAVFHRCLRLAEDPDAATHDTRHAHYFLSIKLRNVEIDALLVHDNPAYRGRPLVSAITLAGAAPSENLEGFGTWRADGADLAPALEAARPGDWSDALEDLADVLYTREADLPRRVRLLEFDARLEAARIRFHGDVWADMLSNMWVQNMSQIAEKFDRVTGKFHESGKDYPWYGGYSGIGTWVPLGVYYSGAFPRCSDHFATLALRLIDDPVRNVNYVDFVDHGFYYYRNNHDADKGPPNPGFDAERYPHDAPSHWGFVCPGGGPPWEINEIPGDEETDGHGATMVARWLVWRTFGKPTDEWLLAPREHVFGKSRWDVTRESAEFLWWLMDRTGMDVMWCEGETTGWGGRGPSGMRLTGADDWPNENDTDKIRRNYANANMYEVYPTYVCMTALRCSAEIAEAVEKPELAARWRAYADRLRSGLVRLLAIGEHGGLTWKQSRYSVYPSLQDSLVQAWFAIYRDGLDPHRWDAELTQITRNTLRRQLGYPYGHAAVLGMGYGQGWLTKAALILDEFDDAGPLLVNIARYAYDKNMDYVDESRDIDWRKYLWLVPEGTNILPDGRWHRIGDLTNGANQGPCLHAMELCAGVDDTQPDDLRILPRVPDPLTGIEIKDFPVLVPVADHKLERVNIAYTYKRDELSFRLEADEPLPTLSVRLGPFSLADAERTASALTAPRRSRTRIEASGTHGAATAWWVWVENMKEVDTVELHASAP